MGKIKKLVLFSDHFNVDRKALYDIGVFNPILNLDTLLFIDPILLKNSKHQIISQDAVNEYNSYFSGIISLLSLSRSMNDFAWESAYNQFPKKEIDGTCLGYGTNSISGRGIKPKLKSEILVTAKEIVNLGIKDPELFSILPLFNKGIGPDTISDITTRAIHKSLLKFTAEKALELSIPTTVVEIYGEDWNVIQNPIKNKSHILLLPNDILRSLPVVEKWEDIADAASFNSSLRNRVNKLLADVFRRKTQRERDLLISNLLKDKVALSDLINVIKGCKALPYDQGKDNDRIVVLGKAKSIIDVDIPNKQSFEATQQGLDDLVNTIVDRFRFLIEDKGLNKLLWKDDKNKRCKESVPQLIFYAVALSYCQANDIDISPELDTGIGLIDFKFSKGYSKKNIVEIKYSDNPGLIHGYKKQLELYKKSEETNSGSFVVLDVGKMGSKDQELQKLYNSSSPKSEIFYIDAKLKKSASKR